MMGKERSIFGDQNHQNGKITVFHSSVLCQGYAQQGCTYHEYVYVIRACTNTSGMYVYVNSIYIYIHQCVIVLSYIT